MKQNKKRKYLNILQIPLKYPNTRKIVLVLSAAY